MTTRRRIVLGSVVAVLMGSLLVGEFWFLLDQPPPPLPEEPIVQDVLSDEEPLPVCDARTACPPGYACYRFEDDLTAVCWPGNPCDGCDSRRCTVLESLPMQVRCL